MMRFESHEFPDDFKTEILQIIEASEKSGINPSDIASSLTSLTGYPLDPVQAKKAVTAFLKSDEANQFVYRFGASLYRSRRDGKRKNEILDRRKEQRQIVLTEYTELAKKRGYNPSSTDLPPALRARLIYSWITFSNFFNVNNITPKKQTRTTKRRNGARAKTINGERHMAKTEITDPHEHNFAFSHTEKEGTPSIRNGLFCDVYVSICKSCGDVIRKKATTNAG
jgi:hypothetical protein